MSASTAAASGMSATHASAALTAARLPQRNNSSKLVCERPYYKCQHNNSHRPQDGCILRLTQDIKAFFQSLVYRCCSVADHTDNKYLQNVAKDKKANAHTSKPTSNANKTYK